MATTNSTIIAKLDCLLDRMESRIDAAERRMDSLRRKQYRQNGHRPPPPHRMGSVRTRRPSCWDPPGNRPLPSFQPYDPPRSWQPSCWEPPPHRASQGYSDYDQPPPCPPSCWDTPRRQTDHFRQQRSPRPGTQPWQHSPPSYWPAQQRRHAYEKQQQTHAYRQQHQPVGDSRPRHQSNPTPVFEHSPYTCTLSDAALQNPDAEYQPHEPPARMEPPDCIFQPLPQPPQPHCCQNAADEERCIGEVIIHTHSPNLDECLDSYLCGYAHELRDQDEDDSSSSSFVAPIGYSCEVTRDFDYYSKRKTVEEEHCENLGSMLLMDSKSETEVEDVCGDDAANSDATGVSISSIALLGERHGVEEDRAVSPADHQVSASKEIYWPCNSDVKNILSTAPLPAAALLSDVDGDFKCLLQGHTHDEWDICLVSNHSVQEYIGRRSVVRYAFDPGGDASQ